MKRAAALLIALLLLSCSTGAQFTIPNNTAAGNPNQALWMQADIDTLVAGVGGNGVLTGLAVTPNSGLTLSVAAGSIQYGGATIPVSGGTVTVSAAAVNVPRLDLVVVSNTGTKSVVTGTAAANPGAPAVPASSILLAMIYVPAADATIDANQIIDKRVFVKTGYAIYRVSDFGALCDGSTDDSAPLQAAFNAADAAGGGTILLPAKTCSFSTPLTVGGSTLHYSMINVVGHSMNTSLLSYNGSSSGVAITLSHVAYFHWQDMQVVRSGSKGTTVGMVLSGPFGGAGTQTLTGHFERVRYQGFSIGLLAGPGGGLSDESSEIRWDRCVFSGNDIGWTDSGFNSLNFSLHDVSIGGNQIGVSVGGYSGFGGWTGAGITIDGADSANNTTADVALGNNFGHTVLRKIRTESTVPMVLGQADYLTVEDCEGTDSTVGHFGIQIGTNGFVELRRNTFNTPIKFTGNGGQSNILVEANMTAEGTAGYPIDFSGFSVGNSGTRMRLIDNRKASGSFFASFFQNREGWFMGGSAGTQWIVEDSDNAPLSVGFNRTFTRSLGYGAQVIGKNLRDRVTFATSATANYTFVRTPTVTINGTKTISFTAGLITAADIGKRISIASATNLCSAGTGAVVGFIATVPSSTTATVVPTPQNANPTCEGNINLSGSVTATVGENEPDADYFLMLGCDTNGETIKWGAKATTGFTLTSSNASSTAKCDVLVVR